MRVRAQLLTLCLASGAFGALTCSSPQMPRMPWAGPPLPEEPATEERAADASPFSQDRAWSHLEALAAIGPRAMGTPGAARARDYILGELEKLGLERRIQKVDAVRPDGSDLMLSNLAAVVPGESEDLFLVVAPYDSRAFESFAHLGVHDGASGVAVALELARVVAAEPLPYTTWFVFLDGEQPPIGETEPARVGSRAFGKVLRERGAAEQVRLALVLNRVCDPDLRIARDLLSHRVYREEFWRAASRLGFSEVFSVDAPFEQPDESHRVLSGFGVRRVVALADTSFGGEEPPGLYAGTEDDDLEHCASDSLGVVGAVSLEGLTVIAERLRRIDRFAESPIAGAEAMRLEDLAGSGADEEPPAPEAQAGDAQAPEAQAGEAPAPDAQGGTVQAPEVQEAEPPAPDAPAGADETPSEAAE